MKIKRIELFNIGPYINKNSFDISISNGKNIVLIGGKNGAGKTTFFKSIKTCLYGCKVWGFDAPGKEYYHVVEKLINSRTQYDTNSKAYIEIELFFNDGKQQNNYVLHREWTKVKRNLNETFWITKNGDMLVDDEFQDFSNYLLSLIPPDMFNFYFFDGESIADYFLGNDGKNFKNAFLKLYGLDTLAIMIENFDRYNKKKDGKNTAYDNYMLSKTNLEKAEQKYDDLKESLASLENSLDLNQIRLQALQRNYSKEGGVSLEEWKSLNSELIKEETLRDELNRWLKDVANHCIPFIILKNELKQLSNQLVLEEENLKSAFVKEVVNRSDFVNQLNKYLDKSGVSAENIVKMICNSVSASSNNDTIFDLSTNQIRKLQSQIEEKLEFDEKDINRAVKRLQESLTRSKKTREKLSKSSVDAFGDFSDEKDRIEKTIMEVSLDIEKKKTEIVLFEQELLSARIDFDNAKQNYESLLKSKSINDLSSRAVAVYTLLEDKLIKEQSIILQNEFNKCFKSIINKDNFIDGIVVDKNINIIPYKFVNVDYAHLDNYLELNSELKFLDLFDNKYLHEINKLRLGNVDKIELPSPITAPFSQGERQVFIMSLYLALLKTSRKDIPFFIDTPFARIDSNHRGKIVSEFFLGISNQIFILSTDEEIVGKYKKQIDKRISDKFMLQIDEYGQTTVLDNVYFGE